MPLGKFNIFQLLRHARKGARASVLHTSGMLYTLPWTCRYVVSAAATRV